MGSYRTQKIKRTTSIALENAGIRGLAQQDFNHLLHYLRGEELKQLPRGVERFISVGCAGTWYFNWIEECCGPIALHTGIEYYSPKPSNLPSGVEWIVNTAGDMSSIDSDVGDILFSGQNVEHLWPSDVTAFLQESWRVLKVGGLLVMDSPNRLITKSLIWSHPEHTVELTPSEARRLVEANGFEVTKLHGMWLCSEPGQKKVFPLDDFQLDGKKAVKRRITDAPARPDDSFCWWLEARKVTRAPEKIISTEMMEGFFRHAWPERVNRFQSQSGIRSEINGAHWFHSVGAAGALMYGPYMPLPAGNYSATIKLKLTKPADHTVSPLVRLDVLNGACQELMVNEVFANEFTLAEVLSKTLNFELTAMTFGIQFRVILHQPAHVACLAKVNLEAHSDVIFSTT